MGRLRPPDLKALVPGQNITLAPGKSVSFLPTSMSEGFSAAIKLRRQCVSRWIIHGRSYRRRVPGNELRGKVRENPGKSTRLSNCALHLRVERQVRSTRGLWTLVCNMLAIAWSIFRRRTTYSLGYIILVVEKTPRLKWPHTNSKCQWQLNCPVIYSHFPVLRQSYVLVIMSIAPPPHISSSI